MLLIFVLTCHPKICLLLLFDTMLPYVVSSQWDTDWHYNRYYKSKNAKNDAN